MSILPTLEDKIYAQGYRDGRTAAANGLDSTVMKSQLARLQRQNEIMERALEDAIESAKAAAHVEEDFGFLIKQITQALEEMRSV